jgi:hypothetical protein
MEIKKEKTEKRRLYFFDSRTDMSASDLESWKLPRKYRREDGMYGSGGKFAIAANVGNRFRIYEYYSSQKEADDAIELLKHNEILTACDLYVVLLDAWIPVPFQAADTTTTKSSRPDKNPFQAYLDAVNSETDQVRKNLAADKGNSGKTAYELYRTSIHTTAMKVLKRAVNSILENRSNLSLLRGSAASEERKRKGYDSRMAKIGLIVSKMIDETMSKDVMLEFKRLRETNTNTCTDDDTATDSKKKKSPDRKLKEEEAGLVAIPE